MSTLEPDVRETAPIPPRGGKATHTLGPGRLAPPAETHEPKRENGGAAPSAAPRRISRAGRLFLTVTLALASLAGWVYYQRFLAPYEWTDNAFLEGRITPIAPQVGGRVAQVPIQDNQEVKAGDLLVEIDPSDWQAKLDQAKAGLAGARSRLQQAEAQLEVDRAKARQEQANLKSAEAEAARAQAELKRYQAVEARAVSRSQIDLAETHAQSAAAQLEALRQKAAAAESQVGLSQASIQTVTAEVRQQAAVLRQAELNLSYTRILAPEDGRVTKRSVEVGALAQPGQALLALVSRQVWIVANFKETQLTHLRRGQRVEIALDAFPGRKIQGRIESFQAGAGARFSLFPPENATGNFIKVVQRVPVKIVIDDPHWADLPVPLGPGMSVEVRVRVRE